MGGIHRKQRKENHHGKSSTKGGASSTTICTNDQYKVEQVGVFKGLMRSLDTFEIKERMALRRMAVAAKLPADYTEDAIQEVWLAAWRARSRFHGRDAIQQLCVWMRGVMLHKIADAFRHMARHKAVSLHTLPSAPATPERDELDRKRRDWLAERLKEAGADDCPNARLLRGRFVEGKTNAELAVEEDLTEKSVESRICRLIKELRQMATKDGLIVPSREGGSPEGNKNQVKKLRGIWGSRAISIVGGVGNEFPER